MLINPNELYVFAFPCLFCTCYFSPSPLPLSCMACVVSQRPCWRWRLPVGLRVWYQPTRWLRLTSPTTRWNSGSSPIPPFLTPTSPTRICKEIIKIYCDESSQMTHFCSSFRTNNRIKRLFFSRIKVQCLWGLKTHIGVDTFWCLVLGPLRRNRCHVLHWMLRKFTCLLSWNPERVCLHEHTKTVDDSSQLPKRRLTADSCV